MSIPRLPLALLLAVLVSGPAAYFLSGTGAEAAADTVAVELGDYSVTAPAKIAAGRVTFETVNTGRVEHELLIVRTDLAPDALPLGLEGPALTVAGKLVLGKPHTHKGYEKRGLRAGPAHIQPTQTRRDTVTLAPGRYVMLCNLRGHYEAGQHAALVVT